MRSYMALGGVVVLIFAAIFLFYTNSFLTRRRRQEFGLYSILGMEKRHIARLLSVETLMLFAASLGLGLGLGALLSKLVGLGALKLIQADAVFGFEFVPGAAKLTAAAFGAIFALILLFEGVQLRRATAIDLMKSREQGEREPKTKALMALLGAIAMGGGYYIAIVTETPIKATMLFFVAVILVIIGTYLLFTAGSIAVLKALRKNKKYYYRPNHFISVSGMIYRMKQNAAGLASICILSTMVLVMLSATISLTIGSEDVIAKQYPHEMQYASMDGDWPNFWETVDEALRPLGVEATNAVEYDLLTFAAAKEGGELLLTPDDRMSPAYVRVLKYDDYAAMAGPRTRSPWAAGRCASPAAPTASAEPTTACCTPRTCTCSSCPTARRFSEWTAFSARPTAITRPSCAAGTPSTFRSRATRWSAPPPTWRPPSPGRVCPAAATSPRAPAGRAGRISTPCPAG